MKATPESAPATTADDRDIVVRLRDTPNWMYESYGSWKDCVRKYSRAPFEAADEIERLRAEVERLAAQSAPTAEALQALVYASKVYRAHGIPTDGIEATIARLQNQQPEPEYNPLCIDGVEHDPLCLKVYRSPLKKCDCGAQSAALQQAAVPPQEFESAQGRALASAWAEGWAQCRDAEFVGEEAEHDAFNQSTTLAQCLDADRAAAQVEPSAPPAPGGDALAAMKARKDAAYEERNKVVAALAKLFPSGIAKTAIEGWSEDWHGCVYIDLPTGQVSWHFHDSQAYLFAGLPAYAGQWDGHDTPEKYRRLAALQSTQAPPATQGQDAAPAEQMQEFWLWKNFVDGRPEYWAFDNPYPINLTDGDPQTLGEPCGYAIFKPSRNGRPDVPRAQVIAAIKRAKE